MTAHRSLAYQPHRSEQFLPHFTDPSNVRCRARGETKKDKEGTVANKTCKLLVVIIGAEQNAIAPQLVCIPAGAISLSPTSPPQP